MSQGLALLNTEQTVDDPALAQTTFWLESGVDILRLHLDRGGHEPTPEEDSLAPFYQDPSQRLLVLEAFDEHTYSFAMRTEALLKLAREWGGAGLMWEQWIAHVVRFQFTNKASLWISGPRLFCLRCVVNAWIDVFDFSPQASARNMGEEVSSYNGTVLRMKVDELHILPWRPDTIYFAAGGHDSIVFLEVDVLVPKIRPKID